MKSDPMLSEYTICRMGHGDMLLGDPLTLSPEGACRRDPERFKALLDEMNRVWQKHESKTAQMSLPLGGEDDTH